jgi:leucyl aminopeptidase (aminopeptidase T)
MDVNNSAMIAARDCMGIKPGEKALIVTDTERSFIGRPLFEAALELGSDAIYLEMRPRTRSGEEPPRVVADAMLYSDVVIAPTRFSLTHTVARKNACMNGTRVATIPLTEGSNELITEMFATGGMTADYFRIRDRVEQLSRRLEGAKQARITTVLGTDITVDLEGRNWHKDTGLALGPGENTNLPGGELFIAPANANGKVVIDGSFGDYGLLETPLELTIRDSQTISARGSHADDLKSLFETLGPGAQNVAEFGIGLNPKARLWGILLEDEKVGNTIHIALGNDSSFGGTCTVPMHFDGIVTHPNVTVDGLKLDIAEYL